MPPGLSPTHILVVFVVALIVLGPQRLPEAARQIGKFFAEFRRWSDSMQSELREALEIEAESAQTPPATSAPEAPSLPAPTPQPVTAAPAARPVPEPPNDQP